MKKLFFLITAIMLSHSATMALANQTDATKAFLSTEPEEFDWHTKGYPTPVKGQDLEPGQWHFEPIGIKVACEGALCASPTIIDTVYIPKEVLNSIARDFAPTDSQIITDISLNTHNTINNTVNKRITSVKGLSAGDTFAETGLWVQGLYNYSKQDSSASTEGFTAHTKGISFGLDSKLYNNWLIGIGYAYTDTNADAGNRDIDVDGHNVFAYTQYKPNNWFINGFLNYGFNKYDEIKQPLATILKPKYHVNTFGTSITTGYDFDNGLTPTIGMRYLLTDRESYNDGFQNVSSDKTNMLTGMVGFGYQYNLSQKDWIFRPNLKLATIYDIISDNSKATATINDISYQVKGKHLNRFGVETGIGLEIIYKNWNLSLDYNGDFRKDYQSHTGMTKVRYNF